MTSPVRFASQEGGFSADQGRQTYFDNGIVSFRGSSKRGGKKLFGDPYSIVSIGEPPTVVVSSSDASMLVVHALGMIAFHYFF